LKEKLKIFYSCIPCILAKAVPQQRGLGGGWWVVVLLMFFGSVGFFGGAIFIQFLWLFLDSFCLLFLLVLFFGFELGFDMFLISF